MMKNLFVKDSARPDVGVNNDVRRVLRAYEVRVLRLGVCSRTSRVPGPQLCLSQAPLV